MLRGRNSFHSISLGLARGHSPTRSKFFRQGQSPRGCPDTLAARDSSSAFHVTSVKRECESPAKQATHTLVLGFNIHRLRMGIWTSRRFNGEGV
jgi:hypothetical protein